MIEYEKYSLAELAAVLTFAESLTNERHPDWDNPSHENRIMWEKRVLLGRVLARETKKAFFKKLNLKIEPE